MKNLVPDYGICLQLNKLSMDFNSELSWISEGELSPRSENLGVQAPTVEDMFNWCKNNKESLSDNFFIGIAYHKSEDELIAETFSGWDVCVSNLANTMAKALLRELGQNE